MKILIAGLGSIGRRHLKNLLSLGEKDIMLFRTNKSTLPDEDLKDFPVHYDINQAFALKPDAVIISNPTAFHMPVAEMAAEQNAHIFLEKPVSHTIDSTLRFEKLLGKSKSRVFVAYQFRFNPGLRKLKTLIKNKKNGEPLSLQCVWGEYLPDWHPWEDYRNSYAAKRDMGGGVVLTLSHPIDYLRWIFGEIAEVFAVAGNASQIEIEVEDFADVLMRFRTGLTGNLHLDYFRQPKQHDLTVICESACLHWDYKDSIVSVEHASGKIEKIPPPAKYDRNQMYLDEMRHFLEICSRNAEPLCTYQDGKQALNIALGILKSAHYHDRVIFEE